MFAYASGDRLAGDAATLLAIIRSAYGAFHERIEEAMVPQKHDCQACIILPSLELKFVVHHARSWSIGSPGVTDAAAEYLGLMAEVGWRMRSSTPTWVW